MCILSKWLSFRVFTVSSMVVQWLHFEPRRSRSKCKKSGGVAGTAKKTQSAGNGRRIFFFSACKNYFIYFWLSWVFVAACGFSLVVASGGSSLVVVRGLLLLRLEGPRAPAQWLVTLRLSCPRTHGVLFPGPGIEPVSSARAGRQICTGRGILNRWTTGEVPGVFFV